MKNHLTTFIFSLIVFNLFAQQAKKDIPIFVGYYGAYVIHPGIKTGLVLNIKEWRKEKRDISKQRNLFISPQIGLFVRSNNHTGFLLNMDGGYKLWNKTGNFYTAPSIGLGGLLISQILSSTIDLGTGEISKRERENRFHFLPTLNFELGKEANKKIGWYTKFTFGRKIIANIEDAGFFALELGLRFSL
jgi:hypothetical protein